MPVRIPFEELKAAFKRMLLQLGFADAEATDCADIFANNSLDGVYTHGFERFPTFVEYIKGGTILPGNKAYLLEAAGAIERWDGNAAPGMLNARHCMDRAMALAGQFGIGCVAIRKNNHWMRGGTYGWQAANAGYIGICFTNTTGLVPPWGGIDPFQGNNPLVIAVPRADGKHVVLDMAMSQYSNGKMLQYKKRGNKLPVAGGFDADGNLTDEPAAVLETKRALPIGFWKGSGLSMMLDLLAAILSKGDTTKEISARLHESGVSQVFIAIKNDDPAFAGQIADQVISFSKSSRPAGDAEIRYPGEGTLLTRLQNQKDGIPVDEDIWQQLQNL